METTPSSHKLKLDINLPDCPESPDSSDNLPDCPRSTDGLDNLPDCPESPDSSDNLPECPEPAGSNSLPKTTEPTISKSRKKIAWGPGVALMIIFLICML